VIPAIHPRRLALGAVKRLLLGDEPAGNVAKPDASSPTKSTTMSRSRERILENLDEMYGEAFDSAKATNDDAQMRTLDFAYRREQLYFEILLDIRDALMARR
jgi:hypothetical protein